MEEIKVGEYGRTNKGKIFIFAWLANLDGKRYANKVLLGNGKIFENKFYYFDDGEEIVKHSKQLIDLIEVKDLVCFKNKLQNSLENEEMIIHIFDNDTLEEVKQAIEKGEIELLEILTHEQFETNCYKVGGEDETSND